MKITTEEYNFLKEERKNIVQNINSLSHLESGRALRRIKEIDKSLTIYEKGVNHCFICGSELIETGMGLFKCTDKECNTSFACFVDNNGCQNVIGSN